MEFYSKHYNLQLFVNFELFGPNYNSSSETSEDDDAVTRPGVPSRSRGSGVEVIYPVDNNVDMSDQDMLYDFGGVDDNDDNDNMEANSEGSDRTETVSNDRSSDEDDNCDGNVLSSTDGYGRSKFPVCNEASQIVFSV